jgi:hypothetical protein
LFLVGISKLWLLLAKLTPGSCVLHGKRLGSGNQLHYHIHKIPSFSPSSALMNLVHSLQHHWMLLCQIHVYLLEFPNIMHDFFFYFSMCDTNLGMSHFPWFDHPNMHWRFHIIKQTRCTNFSILFYFGMKLLFRTVPLSIIRSFSLYTQQCYMSYQFADSLQAGSGWNCSSIPLLRVYSEKLLMMDRETVRNMYSFIPK